MEQYEKSGPPAANETTADDKEVGRRLQATVEKVDRLEKMIQAIEKDLRRIKTKLDAHALTINQIKNRG